MSIPAKAPSTSELTAAILPGGPPLWRYSDGSYVLGENPSPMTAWGSWPSVDVVREFLDMVRHHVRAWSEWSPNYEDISYVISGIREALAGERDDPRLTPLLQIAQHWPLPPESHHDAPADPMRRLHKISIEAVNLIKWAVSRSLGSMKAPPDHIRPLVEMVRDLNHRQLDIFTLNHDRLIEEAYAQAGIVPTDGFGPLEDGVRWWSPSTYSAHDTCVRLLKLHGSIDWHRFRPIRAAAGRDRLGSARGDFGHLPKESGYRTADPGEPPRIIVGRFNKEQEYVHEPFARLFWEFTRILAGHDNLLISGYSFGDKGINTLLINWLDECADRRIIVAHADERLLRDDQARPAIRRCWDTWKASGALLVVPTYLGAMTWPDLRAILV